MICPDCSHENIEGVDVCANCMRDLTTFDEPSGETEIETSIITETLAALHPNPPIILPPEATVADAVTKLCDNDIGCVLVGAADRIVGIFSERDILLRTALRYKQVALQPISLFMTPEPETLDIEASVAFAINRMAVGDFRHIPVTESGRLMGIVSVRDLLTFLSQWYPDLIPAE